MAVLWGDGRNPDRLGEKQAGRDASLPRPPVPGWPSPLLFGDAGTPDQCSVYAAIAVDGGSGHHCDRIAFLLVLDASGTVPAGESCRGSASSDRSEPTSLRTFLMRTAVLLLL